MAYVEIPVSGGLFALVDECDATEIGLYKWVRNPDKRTIYAQRPARIAGRQTTISMHRQILRAEPGQIVDHVNGNGLDNRRANIRLCSIAQNNRNQRTSNMRNGRHRGTELVGSRWRAVIVFEAKTYRLGWFDSSEEAARAYDAKAVELFGEFACTNFPPPTPATGGEGEA